MTALSLRQLQFHGAHIASLLRLGARMMMSKDAYTVASTYATFLGARDVSSFLCRFCNTCEGPFLRDTQTLRRDIVEAISFGCCFWVIFSPEINLAEGPIMLE